MKILKTILIQHLVIKLFRIVSSKSLKLTNLQNNPPLCLLLVDKAAEEREVQMFYKRGESTISGISDVESNPGKEYFSGQSSYNYVSFWEKILTISCIRSSYYHILHVGLL